VFSDPSRLVCGVATCFSVRSSTGIHWTREQFQEWFDLGMALPVLHDHLPIIDLRGWVVTIGNARLFEPVGLLVDGFPLDCLLCLVEVDYSPWGDSVLAELRSSLAIWSGRSRWGFSIGAHHFDDMVVPFELSITSRPSFSDAKILAVGGEALETWELLTEPAAVH
jgi:hypothetical protein